MISFGAKASWTGTIEMESVAHAEGHSLTHPQLQPPGECGACFSCNILQWNLGKSSTSGGEILSGCATQTDGRALLPGGVLCRRLIRNSIKIP